MRFEITADNVAIQYCGFTLTPRKRLREIALLVGDINTALVNTVAEATVQAAMEMMGIPDDVSGLE